MGIKGLWQLLLPIGRRISIETLEGQVLAVDASIWLTQFLKAMRDPETGKVQPAAHLKGFFRRVCRLLYHNIKPVFVFDGATPEIKAAELALRRRRREQFAHASQETMHRLAKKLLHQNLLKEKIKIANRGSDEAFERGFNLGDQESATNAVPQRSQDDEPGNEGSPVGLQEDEAINPTENELEDVNDWDDPTVTEQEQLLQLGLYDSDDDDDKTDVGPGSDMSFLASLPPNRRKDAIEKAQRRHRMQSRKEHMPVAGDPFAFSNVQMANFLKSSRLNKSIQTALAAAVKHDNNGGDVMASDATTRLELIREDEPVVNRRLRRQQPHDNSDSESEPEWEPTQSAPSWHAKLSPCLNSSSSTGSGSSSESIKRRQKRKRDQDQDTTAKLYQIADSEDDCSIDEGPDSKEANQLPFGHNVQSPILVDSDSEVEDGGFLRGGGDSPEQLTRCASSPVKLKEAKDTKANLLLSDRAVAQELHDQFLAEALQQAECETIKESITVDDGSQAKASADIDTASPLESDDESIDWEDGEATSTVACTKLNSLDADHEQFVEDDDWVENKVASFDSDDDSNLYPKVKRVKRDFRADDTSAALERAQKEAANLADWAGRVFRRAVKDALKSDQPSTVPANTCTSSTQQKNGELAKPPSIAKSSILSSFTAVAADQKDATHFAEDATLQYETNHASSRSSPRRSRQPQTAFDGGSSNVDQLDQALMLVEMNDSKWAEERNKRERDMDTVTDEMKLEVMQLLQLLGVPYLEAPAEAESQCVELERLGLVDGIITEDSDVFVFGGRRIFKNIFEDQKFAEAYIADDAAREMGLGPNEMVALAMLLGGDYTEGVKGVGIVNAMEILEAFDFTEGAKEGLSQFKKWLDGIDLSGIASVAESTASNRGIKAFHIKHKSARSRWTTPDNFPADNVLKAYLQPVVDSSKDRFSWGKPDCAGLLVYCNRNIGWSADETKAFLNQLTERPRSGLRQMRLDAYMPMRYEDSITFANVRSKRLQDVLRKKQSSQNEDGDGEL